MSLLTQFLVSISAILFKSLFLLQLKNWRILTIIIDILYLDHRRSFISIFMCAFMYFRRSPSFSVHRWYMWYMINMFITNNSVFDILYFITDLMNQLMQFWTICLWPFLETILLITMTSYIAYILAYIPHRCTSNNLGMWHICGIWGAYLFLTHILQ